MVKNRVKPYLDAMKPKQSLAEQKSREVTWSENIRAMLDRWPKTVPRAHLAIVAGVREEYVSRLHKQCPKSDDPSREVIRLCDKLRVDPMSLFLPFIRTLGKPPSEDEAKAMKPWKPLAIDDEEAMETYPSLKPSDRKLVRELISRLSGKS